MLRFGGRDHKGRRVIGMILSLENLERLRDGQAVFFDGATVGADDVVVILHVTDKPEAELVGLIRETRLHGGEVRPIEEALEDRAAVRAVGGDPDAEPTH